MAEATMDLEREVETLREEKRVLVKQVERSQREIEWLRHRLAGYMRRLFGPRADTIDLSQLALPFDELIELAIAEQPEEVAESAREAADEETGTRAPRKKGAHGRKPLPKDLPRLRVEHHPADKSCPSCKREMAVIGEEVSEELDWQPATLTVTEHVRPKYACKACQDGVVIAALPPRPIEKGRPGPGLLAHVLVSKYADHLPLHRQEGIFERSGVELSRSTLCDWVGACAELLAPIASAIRRSVLESAVIHSDDTPVLCQENSQGAGKRQSYLWVYAGERGEVVYDFTLSRSRDGPNAVLGTWSGFLQVDGYAGYEELFRSGRVVEVACWAHVRRKYVDALPGDTARASRMVALIQQLYRIESRAKELGLDAAGRAELRRDECPPILERIRQQIDEDERAVLPKSGMGVAVGYARNQWPALVRYMEDGRLSIDNNAAERAMRTVAVGRKNWLFAGSPEGGQRAATIYTLVGTCKLVGVEPFAYLRDVLERVSTHPASRVDELTPRGWKAARAAN